MLRIYTHPTDPAEPLFRLEIPKNNTEQVEGDGDRVEIMMPAHVANLIVGILSAEWPGMLQGKHDAEVVEMIASRVVASMPAAKPEIRITALAMALVSVWEMGIFGAAKFEVGSTMNHVQALMINLAANGPGHYRTKAQRRGSVVVPANENS